MPEIVIRYVNLVETRYVPIIFGEKSDFFLTFGGCHNDAVRIIFTANI